MIFQKRVCCPDLGSTIFIFNKHDLKAPNFCSNRTVKVGYNPSKKISKTVHKITHIEIGECFQGNILLTTRLFIH